MAVWIAAAVVFLFYFASIPVELALRIDARPGLRFGAGIAVFEGRFALRQAEKRINGEKKHLPWGRFSMDAEKRPIFRALKYLFRHLKIENLTISGSISLQDAAATAMVCGWAEAAYAAILPFRWSEHVSMRLSPDFSGGRSDLKFSGMVSANAGHIICAALLCAVYLAEGRFEQWKSTRLKIS